MVAEQVQPDTFNLHHHKLQPSIESTLHALLKEYASPLAKIRCPQENFSQGNDHDTGNSDPVLQKPNLIAMKNYQWVKDEIETLLTAEVICSSSSSC